MKVLKYWRTGLLGVVASLLAVYFIISQMKDVGLMWSALRHADYGWVLVSMGVIVVGLFARGARWRALLGGALPFVRAFSITNVSYLVNGVLPLRIGELARAYLAAQVRPPVPILKSVGTIVVERLIDVLAVLIILALALSAGPLPEELRSAALVFAPLVVVGFAFLILLARQRERALRLAERLISRIAFLQRRDWLAWVRHVLDGLTPLTQPAALTQVLLLAAASWACSLLSGYVLMIAFFGHGDWATTCLFSAA
ncbi:MAG: lysylphosphatidylglycerol synthase transmembrane domain-containing protein, partial [Anaerolineae bacterium]